MIQVLFVDSWRVEVNIRFQLKPIDVGDVQKWHSLLIKLEPTLCELTEWLVAFFFEKSDLLPVAAFALLLL
jgi:hypothetical protein